MKKLLLSVLLINSLAVGAPIQPPQGGLGNVNPSNAIITTVGPTTIHQGTILNSTEVLQPSNNLSDVSNAATSRGNLGLPTQTLVLNLDQDYVIANPAPGIIYIDMPTSGHVVKMPPIGVTGALDPSSFIQVAASPTSHSISIEDSNGNDILTISAGEKYIANPVGVVLSPPTGWVFTTAATGGSQDMQSTYNYGSNVTLADDQPVMLATGESYGDPENLTTLYSPSLAPTPGASYVIGMAFTMSETGVISSLGYADPLFSSGTRQVGLWSYTTSTTGTLLATANVSKSDPLDALTGRWRMHAITPVNVTKGTRYVVAELNPTTDQWLYYQWNPPDFCIVDGISETDFASPTLVYPPIMSVLTTGPQWGNANLLFQPGSGQDSLLFNDSVSSTTTSLQLNSTTRGSQPWPVMSDAQFAAISAPSTALTAFTTTSGRQSIFDGSQIQKFSYVSDFTGGAIASGTWPISISGNSATVTNGLYSTGGTMTGNLFLNADPMMSTQAATKNYVDLTTAGMQIKTAVAAASTANVVGTYNNGSSGIGATFTVTATGTFSLDGHTVVAGERDLFKNQTSGFQNGVYDCTIAGSTGISAVFTRSADYNTPATVDAGSLIPVINGSTEGGTLWLQSGTVNTIGTDSLVFSQFAIPTTITGTPNQVIASASTGPVTLSLPQNINSSATPQFQTLTLSGTGSGLIFVNNSATDSSTIASLNWNGLDSSSSTVVDYGLLSTILDDNTAGVTKSEMDFSVRDTGTVTKYLTLDGYNQYINLMKPVKTLTIGTVPLSGITPAITLSNTLTDGNFINNGGSGRNIGVLSDGTQFIAYNLDYNATSGAYKYNTTNPAVTIEENYSGIFLKSALSGTVGTTPTLSTNMQLTNSGGVELPGLSTSSLVATDGSKILTSSVSGLSPTFTGLNLSGLTASSIVTTDSSKNLATPVNPQSYTPTIGDGTHNFTTSTASGKYYQLGSLYIVHIQLVWTSVGSASGTVLISLPATIGASDNRVAATIGFASGITFTGSYLTSTGSPGGNSLSIVSWSTSGVGNNVQVSQMASSGELQLNLTMWSN
jgi:hypothetical protein